MTLKLRYTVSEEIYTEMLEAQLKRKNKTPLSIILTLLCTVGQMGFLVYMIARGAVTGKHIYILGAMSLIICVLNIAYRLTTHRRAYVTLKNFIAAGKLSPEFWKGHELRLDENSLVIKHGSLRSAYELRDINGYEELNSAFLLYVGGTVADIIPYTALSDKSEFIEAIRKAQHEKIIVDAEKGRENIPAVYNYAFDYAYTLDSYIAQQKEAYRKMYTTKLIYTPQTIIRFFVSIYALAYIGINPSPLTAVLCIFAFIALNLQHITTFTPLCNATIKRGIADVLEHKPDPATTTYITPDMIVVRGSMHSLDIPVSDVKAMRTIKNGVALYLPKNVILTIPNTETVDDGDFDKFIKFMNYKAN